MKEPVVVRAHIPRGSGDAEYRIESQDGTLLVAIVDPEMAMVNPADVAEKIAAGINAAEIF